MQRAPRINRAQAVALPRPQLAMTTDWIVAVVAVALLLTGLLAP
jgi:hypothetical protein